MAENEHCEAASSQVHCVWGMQLRSVCHGVIHTNQGFQFRSADVRKGIDKRGMIQSFSAKGHHYDSAVMECFFGINIKSRGAEVENQFSFI
jgi:transposase InsO family protein